MRAPQRGIALILVLWVITLLTVMALGLTAVQRTETELTRNGLETVRFRALSEAALNYTALTLVVPPPNVDLDVGLGADPDAVVWMPDGAPHEWQFGGEPLTIRIFNEGSRVDLNQADADLLSRLFAVLGVEPDAAAALADSIVDWRDEDDLHQLNGAEDGDYRQAGLPYGAKDERFTSVEELQQVLGMDRALYRRLAPLLTVAMDGADVERTFAPAAILAALDNTTIEDAEIELETRALEEGAGNLDRGGPLYRIQITRAVDSASSVGMEALIKIEPGPVLPFQVLWRRFGITPEAPQPQLLEDDGEDLGW